MLDVKVRTFLSFAVSTMEICKRDLLEVLEEIHPNNTRDLLLQKSHRGMKVADQLILDAAALIGLRFELPRAEQGIAPDCQSCHSLRLLLLETVLALKLARAGLPVSGLADENSLIRQLGETITKAEGVLNA